ncbi:MAG TPA: DUF58 domain-containing protein [Methylomirabilota bacterium]|jgi:uncharacterized protein (DUF58 family)|nr:DUF58 domain-containing protein [Methylomirabilota bacterium]
MSFRVVPHRWLWRLVRPRRTIWPTRDGWWCLFVVMGLGVAAINTGNNLLYLLVSLLLSLIIVSGILSEQSMRGLALTAVEPDEIYAGRPALFGAVISNRKRWLTSYSVTIEFLSAAAAPRFLYLPRLEAGAERLVTWEDTLARRGRHPLAGVRLTTRFPFGLFLKAGRSILTSEAIVYPAVRPVSPELVRQLGTAGDKATRRRGRGADLYNLRAYRVGDDPRLIHWRSSAKTQTLTVRELEAETTEDTRVVLTGGASGHGAALEAGLSAAASLCSYLIRAGAGVELVGHGVHVHLGRGKNQLRRALTALALYEPDGMPLTPIREREGPRPTLREVTVRLD